MLIVDEVAPKKRNPFAPQTFFIAMKDSDNAKPKRTRLKPSITKVTQAFREFGLRVVD